jgi:hypothetical protein
MPSSSGIFETWGWSPPVKARVQDPRFAAEIMMAAGALNSGMTVKRSVCKSMQTLAGQDGTRAMEVHPGLKLAEVSSHCHC